MTLLSAILSVLEPRISKTYLGHWFFFITDVNTCSLQRCHSFSSFLPYDLVFLIPTSWFIINSPFFQVPLFCLPIPFPVISPTSLTVTGIIRGHFIDVTNEMTPFLLLRKLPKRRHIFQAPYSYKLLPASKGLLLCPPDKHFFLF